jgi:alkylation response protein AidB-like acyl-CoA dehydrogenase
MNFNLSEEQAMIKDSVARFVADDYNFDQRRQNVAMDKGFNPANWQTFAELGWLSIPFPEALGGFGGNAVDTMVIMEEFGKGLVVEPYVATVLLFGGLLAHSGDGELQQQLIAKIIDGSLQGSFAYLERQSRFELCDVKTSAVAEGDNYRLNGEKTVVFNGSAADKIIISVRTSGEQYDENGISLFIVDADADGLNRTDYRLMDGQRASNISLDNVVVSKSQLIGELDQGFSLIQSVVAETTRAICAEAVGIMQKLTETTVEYSKTREQFGTAIGKFQALQHRMVDMFIAGEQTRSLLYRAVCSAEANSDETKKDLLALKVMVGRAGTLIGGEAIQLHGGMGMTDELDVGHYAKRLMMINTTFGDADYNQARFSKLINS